MGALTASTVTKAIKAALTGPDGPFASPWPPRHPGWGLDVAVRRQRDKITIEWGAGPSVDVVRAVVEATIGGLDMGDHDVAITFQRTEMWSCGYFHQNAWDAWVVHHGSEHETLVGACDCCGQGGEYVLTDDTIDDLRSRGYAFEPTCKPGNYVRCPHCTNGTRVEWNPSRISRCETCDGVGTLDLDVPAAAAIHEQVMARAVEAAWAEHRRIASTR